MVKKKNVLIYPFDAHFCPVIRHNKLISGIGRMEAISPAGWGLTGMDAGNVDGGIHSGIEVSDEFDELFELCDMVFFTRSEKTLDFNKYVYPKMKKSIEKNKDIICTMDLSSEVHNELRTASENRKISFSYCNSCHINKADIPDLKPEELLKIKTPVVFLLGEGENTNKFEVQLALRENFMNMGYKISQVGSRSYCELLGFHSFPPFMNSNGYNESEKIILFNHYFKKLELKENPDIIIVGIPGEIMPYSNEIFKRFGITAFEVSQAVSPDIVIFNSYYNDYTDNYFKEIQLLLKYKLGFTPDCHVISNMKIDYNETKENSDIVFIKIDSQYIDNKIREYPAMDLPVYNALNTRDMGDLANYIIDKLGSYSDIVCG